MHDPELEPLFLQFDDLIRKAQLKAVRLRGVEPQPNRWPFSGQDETEWSKTVRDAVFGAVNQVRQSKGLVLLRQIDLAWVFELPPGGVISPSRLALLCAGMALKSELYEIPKPSEPLPN